MKKQQNVVSWFEIPVSNMDRAIRFYEEVFGYKMERVQMGPLDMAWFPYAEDQGAAGAAGSLVYHETAYKPSQDGTLVYFTGPSGDLNKELSRVEKAGGKILSPKKQITPEIGYMALILDTEGNRIALHTRD